MNEIENENIPQPLDALMTKLNISNADLVKASTEQLSFKMVQKGRTGRHLTPNVQDKILNALIKLKPQLKFRRRELFHYPMDEAVIEGIHSALELVAKKKIKYPQLVDKLVEAGVNHYAVNIAENKTTYYGAGGGVYIKENLAVIQGSEGRYHEAAVKAAIQAAQKESIDYPTFLKRIHEAGIVSYEVNLRQRKITYKGIEESYRESIPVFGIQAEEAAPKAVKPIKMETPAAKRKKRLGIFKTTRKARIAARKRYFAKKKKRPSRRDSA